jgi:hypothetical protein
MAAQIKCVLASAGSPRMHTQHTRAPAAQVLLATYYDTQGAGCWMWHMPRGDNSRGLLFQQSHHHWEQHPQAAHAALKHFCAHHGTSSGGVTSQQERPCAQLFQTTEAAPTVAKAGIHTDLASALSVQVSADA